MSCVSAASNRIHQINQSLFINLTSRNPERTVSELADKAVNSLRDLG